MYDWVSRIFGLPGENFALSPISRSVNEFGADGIPSWQSSYDYVFHILGGSRVKTGLYVRNVIAVWMLTGLWHGASWNFVFMSRF